MSRSFNFCSGPAALPEAVLKKAQAELLNWHGAGVSVMEMSHRSSEFTSILESAKARLTRLLDIPDNYEILFVQGGASTLFAQIPANFVTDHKTVCYLDTGAWSAKAIKEAKKYADVIVSGSTKEQNYTTVPSWEELNLDPNAAYLHITPNETIGGLEFDDLPETDLPIIADLSSTILSRSIDVSKYGMIYAGAQKNVGPAGVVICIVRKDLLERSDNEALPSTWSFANLAKNNSMINTPPTFAIYLADLVFEWLEALGGVEAIEKVNEQKAARLYKAIDGSKLYSNPIDVAYRSRMNVPFVLADESLEQTFLAESEAAGLRTLAGHRSVGGMRASIYNAMPVEGVEALIEFMRDFESRYGA
ncbi:3-phosphoserine/phosphohydroxythreonine transaminase [Marinomonas mediterranea]|jgi:phosphoserine aminotransferase|uniref:Phosphoserine aminotransferase n=1 Tax=Marinomonas mediterranea (strain ATCC 700492 / JCM 21426 / NBRC 103028 / MMB-1) TaxID=717774 RepID=F2JXC5_MARM1|nr:3-phosphoserine/phosphohydroxythreonine transaminase [Marinomonas mediterranea]ADZ90731.1 Phosphoserine aminotransferase [Marinomonas mediterranea MMB-1]WCN08778.1 3-phosphoserine/phosphohydroxythreonine transaminase [Marinomonas mediterranea]WCN16890.1 3-phosphoserine/phosphohydroxythreonine transaminase [Marinomonas mediterranea MMB-1]